MVAGPEPGTAGPDAVHNADTFMAKNASWRASGDVALQDVQVGAADRGLSDLDDGVACRLKDRLGTLFQGFEARTAIHQGFHGPIPLLFEGYYGRWRGPRFDADQAFWR